MGTKRNPGPNDCWDKADLDEPRFALLARDPLGPFLVSIWAAVRMGDQEKAHVVFETMIRRAGGLYALDPDVDKASEAMECSLAMFAWRGPML